MDKITKTIQIYTPEEKLPIKNTRFIAIEESSIDYDKDGTEYEIPGNAYCGIKENKNYILGCQIGTATLSDDAFRKIIKYWYYLPYPENSQTIME